MFESGKVFWKGVTRAIAFYTIGAVLVWITYLLFGWEYVHAPAAHHMVGLLVLVIGAVLLIRRSIGLLMDPKNSHNKGALLVHAIAVVSFILFFKLIILNGAIKRDTGEPLTSKNVRVHKN